MSRNLSIVLSIFCAVGFIGHFITNECQVFPRLFSFFLVASFVCIAYSLIFLRAKLSKAVTVVFSSYLFLLTIGLTASVFIVNPCLVKSKDNFEILQGQFRQISQAIDLSLMKKISNSFDSSELVGNQLLSQAILEDPWGNVIRIEKMNTLGGCSSNSIFYTLLSAGPDRVFFSEDDIKVSQCSRR